MNTFRIIKTAVTDVATTAQPGARIGVLQLSKGYTLPTPNYIAPTSRGAVPHLSPDNLEKHTGVLGVYVALEDFIEKAPQRPPPLYDFPGPLRDFIALPSPNFVVLAARRCPPIVTPKPNSDAKVSIFTSFGFRELPVKDYVSNVIKLRPDVIFGLDDIPNVEGQPGKNRSRKMGERTEKWLRELIGQIDDRNNAAVPVSGDDTKDTSGETYTPAVFAPILPIDIEKQWFYLDYLIDNVDKLSGLVFPDHEYLYDLPKELDALPRVSPDVSSGPHAILNRIDAGIDIFNVNFTGTATDAGIALHFEFGTAESDSDGGGVPLEQLDLGTDMWTKEFAADLSPLEKGCDCYTCKKHHKAFIQHCLSAKEMTAWVLLQLHNLNVLDRFFVAVRKSIEDGTWEKDKEDFERRYKRELPEKTGAGPRLRGYQGKSLGGDKKLNDPAYRSFAADEMDVDTQEADTEMLMNSGFVQKIDNT